MVKSKSGKNTHLSAVITFDPIIGNKKRLRSFVFARFDLSFFSARMFVCPESFWEGASCALV